MKRVINLLIAISGIVFLTSLPLQRAAAQPGGYVSFQEFYDDLSPYGQWIDDAQYGYVWVPYAEDDFRPYYSHGYWIMTDYGNTWVSDYPWGWAPFHYGRWVYDGYYGWLWVPGSDWGPAWVSWRYGDGYYGWAPLAPGFNISIGFGNYYCPDDWWVFLPPRYIYSPRYYNYWHGPRDNDNIIHRTRPVDNTYTNPHTNGIYVTGPRAEEVQRVTNQPVRVYRINPATRPGATDVNGNVVSMYRPVTVQSKMPNGSRPMPNNVVTAPQPVSRPQPVGVNAGQRPGFRANTTTTPPQRGYEQPQQPVERQQNYQPPTPVPPQRGYQPPTPPVQRQQNYQPQQPPQRNYQAPQPPIQRNVTPPPTRPPVQRSAPQPPPPPPVRVQPQRSAPVPQQQNNTPLRH